MHNNRRKPHKSSSASRLTNEEYCKINSYVIYQLKKKLLPFYLRPFNKFKFQQTLNSPPLRNSQQNHVKNRIFRVSQALTDRNCCPKNIQKRNKIRSQMQDVIDEDQIKNLKLNYIQPSEKIKRLKKKVRDFMQIRKSEIYQKQNNAPHQFYKIENNSQQQKDTLKYHHRITSSEQSKFDFSKINTFITQNYENITNFPHQQLKEKQFQQEQLYDHNTNQNQNQVKIKKRREKCRKSLKFVENLKKKNSIRLIGDGIHDEIDLQFKQGLVEQIYTIKRIKFRRKIFQSKSKKKLFQSKNNLQKQ